MTRKFFHLCLLISFLGITSCSLLDSEPTVPANELDGEVANLDDVEGTESTEDFEDLDVESASTSDSNGQAAKDNSFNEIEDFNSEMIEDELSDENFGTDATAQVAKTEPEAESIEDLDLETATPPPSVDAPEVTASAATNSITNLEYKSQESGGSVVISAESTFEYNVREEPDFNQTIIEISNIKLPPRLKQPYIAKDFDQAVATINAYQEKNSTTATIVIQYKDKMKPVVSLLNNSLYIKNIAKGSSDSFVANAVVPPTSTTATAAIDSEKVLNIQMDDIATSELIKLIAEEVGFNVIVDEDVTGKVNNVKLVDVPWQEGFSTILGAQGLAYERRGQILRVAKVEKITAELNATKLKLEAEAGAKSAASSLVIKVVPINYGELTSLITQVRPVLTPSKGQATPDIRSNSIVLYDLEDNVKRAEQIIRSLDVKPIQVLIEGKIIEAKSDVLKQFGINWTTSASPGSISSSLNVTGVAVQGPGSAPGGALGSVSFGTLGLLDNLSAFLAVYEQEEKIKVLSSPRVTTINKERAVIKQSEQVPIVQVTQVAGAGTISSTSFRDALLQIEVTPQVTFNSDMILDIKVDRDIPGTNFNGSRAINTRHAEAKVLVKDGQSVVMGGILSMDENLTDGGIPLLKDIPIFGYLFKTVRKQITKNELVIFLQPKILNSDFVPKDIELGKASETLAPPSQNNTTGGEDNLEKELEAL